MDLGQLHFDLYNSDSFVSRLRDLLDHKDPAVRFHALSAVFPALNSQDIPTQALLRKLCSDPNEGVRKSAEAGCRSTVPDVAQSEGRALRVLAPR